MEAETRTVAGYRLLSLLGRGGMSTVFLADDSRLRRKVAIKILSDDLAGDVAFRERFVRESRLAASLDHPNIIPIFEAGEADGVLYIAMRHVEGADLKSIIRDQGPLEIDEAEEILRQVAAALDAAHSQDLVHRDVKPGNILIAKDSSRRTHAYLADFGLTKRADSKSALTATGTFVGTIHYTSPEQIKAESVDGRADLYSLACVSYECLTGVVPFPRELEMAVLWAHMQDRPPRVTERRPDLPAAVDGVIARALAKVPEDRYGTCSEFVDALITCLAGGTQRVESRQRRTGPDVRVMLVNHPVDSHMVVRVAEKLQHAGLTATPAEDVELEAETGPYLACCVFIGGAGLPQLDRRNIRAARDAVTSQPHLRFIPVLLPGVSEPFEARALPPFLASQPWVDLRRGLEDPQSFKALVDAISEGSASERSQEGVRYDVPPYRGLRPFEEKDSVFFFGREADVQRLLEDLKATRFLAVLGPSGSGKSSLVRAGLVPSLKVGALPGSERWVVRLFKPGPLPLLALASELIQLNPSDDVESLHHRLSTDPTSLHLASALSVVEPHEDARVVWVIDQIEEIFTLCRDDKERRAFIDNLLYAALAPGGRAFVAVTMRADFYPHCAEYPELARAVTAGQYLVSPMDREGLRRAIEGPAALVGLSFEDGLVESILDDVGSEPGSLPLLEHAMYELWEGRRGAFLTLDTYVQAGGVQGALANRAEAIYATFDKEEQEICRRIMLRLTRPGEGTEDTRRRARSSELLVSAAEIEATEAVTSSLVTARLLTVSSEPETTESLVEVAHEALIRAWPRLRGWIEQDRAGLALHRHVTEAATEWKRLEKDEGLLFRGVRLAEATEWQASHTQELNDLEREFLAASARAQEHEIHRVRRTNRRLRGLLVGVGVLLVLALIAGSLALAERGRAVRQSALTEKEAQRAERAASISRSRELAAKANAQLLVDPELSILLSMDAAEVAPTEEAEVSLRRAISASHIRNTMRGHEGLVTDVSISPDGSRLLTGGFDETVRLWGARTGEVIKVLQAHSGPITATAFDPKGDRFVTASEDGTARLWTVNGKLIAALRGHQGHVTTTSFDKEGDVVLTAGSDGIARLWDASNGAALSRLTGHDGTILDAEFGPSGSIVTGTSSGVARIWRGPRRDLSMLLRGHTGAVLSVSVSPNRRWVLTTSRDGTARLWNPRTGAEAASLVGHSREVVDGEFAPDSRSVVTAASDGTARIWEVPSGRQTATLAGHDGRLVTSASFDPFGERVVTTGDDATARIWGVDTGVELSALRGHGDEIMTATFDSSGGRVATASGDGTAKVWDASGQTLSILTGHKDWVWSGIFLQPSDLVATAGEDGTARIWDWTEGRLLHVLRHPNAVYGLDLDEGSNRLITMGRDPIVRVWDVSSGALTMKLEGLTAEVNSGAFAPEQRLVASGSADGTALVWDLDSPKRPIVLRHSPNLGNVGAIAFSPDGSLIATGGRATGGQFGSGRVWSLPTGSPRLTLDQHEGINDVAFSPDGRRLVSAADNGTAVIWDVKDGRQLRVLEGHTDEVLGAEFSPAGDKVLTGGADGTCRIWDADTGEVLHVLDPGAGTIFFAGFNRDGSMVVTGEEAGTAHVWGADDGDEIVELSGHADSVVSAALDPNGTMVLTTSDDGTARVFSCDVCRPLPELIELGKQRVTRELTGEERADFL